MEQATWHVSIVSAVFPLCASAVNFPMFSDFQRFSVSAFQRFAGPTSVSLW
jgi:hypothetical protein